MKFDVGIVLSNLVVVPEAEESAQGIRPELGRPQQEVSPQFADCEDAISGLIDQVGSGLQSAENLYEEFRRKPRIDRNRARLGTFKLRLRPTLSTFQIFHDQHFSRTSSCAMNR